MSASCNGCGCCCDPIVLGMTQREARMKIPEDDEHARDLAWMVNDLRPIPAKDALERHPFLRDRHIMFNVEEGNPTAFAFYYECRHFDRETRQCGNYENRPPICVGYPWYDAPPNPDAALPPLCSYIEDIPVKLRNPAYEER